MRNKTQKEILKSVNIFSSRKKVKILQIKQKKHFLGKKIFWEKLFIYALYCLNRLFMGLEP